MFKNATNKSIATGTAWHRHSNPMEPIYLISAHPPMLSFLSEVMVMIAHLHA